MVTCTYNPCYVKVDGYPQPFGNVVAMETWDERVATVLAMGTQTLVEGFIEIGMSWSDLAELCKASVSTVRAWAKASDDATEPQRLALAQLAAALYCAHEAGIEDPAAWLETPFSLSGVQVRPLDIATVGSIRDLCVIAKYPMEAINILNRVDPGWRQRSMANANFEVFIDTDGQRSIRVANRG